jgi:hypothetical protein
LGTIGMKGVSFITRSIIHHLSFIIHAGPERPAEIAFNEEFLSWKWQLFLLAPAATKTSRLIL